MARPKLWLDQNLRLRLFEDSVFCGPGRSILPLHKYDPVLMRTRVGPTINPSDELLAAIEIPTRVV